ncbi:hypothetical protein B0O99DRAFT_684417 [Bisporella sp. PMI_857]|nr:hypothetical protein B0O99DRAFT_684417 [Bisporella sp. PMI_857]
MSVPTHICVYPLSPTYLPFHRYLYYLSIIISVLYPTPPPLVKGAFAFSLTYSSTAAIYAILIIALPTNHVISLDIFGLWAVLSTASVLALPLLQWTKNLRSNARPIIRIWGALVIAATICIYVLLLRSKEAVKLSGGEDWDLERCWADNDPPKLKLRDPEDTHIATSEPVFGYFYGLIVERVAGLVIMPLVFGAISCLFAINLSQPRQIQRARLAYTNTPITSIEHEQTGRLPIFSSVQNAFVQLRKVVLALTPLMFVPTLVINEMFLLRNYGKGILEEEKMYEVGQWGIFVGAGLVAVAALISEVAGKTKRRVNEFGIEVDGLDVSTSNTIVK